MTLFPLGHLFLGSGHFPDPLKAKVGGRKSSRTFETSCCLLPRSVSSACLTPRRHHQVLSFSQHPICHHLQIMKKTQHFSSCSFSLSPLLKVPFRILLLLRLPDPSTAASHYCARGASPLHLPVMDFRCFDRLAAHVVEASLSRLASLALAA